MLTLHHHHPHNARPQTTFLFACATLELTESEDVFLNAVANKNRQLDEQFFKLGFGFIAISSLFDSCRLLNKNKVFFKLQKKKHKLLDKV